MSNLTLPRSDSYLSHVKTAIKPNTLASLRTAPLQLAMPFPEDVLKRAEDIVNFENTAHLRRWFTSTLTHIWIKESYKPAWKNIGSRGQSKRIGRNLQLVITTGQGAAVL